MSGVIKGRLANIRVQYTHGYAEDSGPADVTAAVLQLVNAALSASKAGAFKSGEGTDGVKIVWNTLLNLPGVDQDNLNAIRKPRYG